MITEGITLVTVALRAYMSYNKEKGQKRKREYFELEQELNNARNARNDSNPKYNRDRIAKARQKLKAFEETIAFELNEEMNKEGIVE